MAAAIQAVLDALIANLDAKAKAYKSKVSPLPLCSQTSNLVPSDLQREAPMAGLSSGGCAAAAAGP